MDLFDIPVFFLLSFGGGVAFFAWLYYRHKKDPNTKA